MGIYSRIVDWVTTPYTIFLILKDPTIKSTVKLRAIIGLAVILAYVISPIDLVPDVIPLAGWLDDLIVVPLGLALIRRLTPGFDVVAMRARAQASVTRILFWIILSLALFVLVSLAWLGLLIYLIVKLITG